MCDVVLKDGKWWIVYRGRIVSELGGFDDPVTPKIIVEEMENE